MKMVRIENTNNTNDAVPILPDYHGGASIFEGAIGPFVIIINIIRDAKY